MRGAWVAWSFWAAWTTSVADAAYTVVITGQVSGAAAGAPFANQPEARLFDDNNQLAIGFVGFMRADMYLSPTGNEPLLFDNGTATSSDLLANRVPIVDGIARFKGLFFNLRGPGYQLRVIAEDEDLDQFAFALTELFEVVTGEPYRLNLQGFPSGGLGGTPFSVQPLVVIVDRGGNPVDEFSEGRITVSIVDEAGYPSPVPGEELLPASRRSRSIVNGLCQFSELRIRTAAAGYWLEFVATGIVLGAGVSVRLPYAITIFVGPPAALEFTRPMSTSHLGGEPLPVQPIVRVVDAGGNAVVADSTSLVVAFISTNPTATTFLCDRCASIFVDRGVATYSNLGLNAAGRRYIVRFTLRTYSTAAFAHVDSGIALDSAVFNVNVGAHNRLSLLTEAYRGAAQSGGAAFPQQPQLRLYDRGGNLVESDSESVVLAGIVTSLSTYYDAEIDTRDGPVPVVLRLVADYGAGTVPTEPGDPGSWDGRPTLAAGDVLKLRLIFDADVYMPDSFIELNADNGTSLARAFVDSPWTYGKEHTFTYLVRLGDSTRALDVSSPRAWYEMTTASSAGVVDPFGRPVNVTLPFRGNVTGSLANTSAVAVSNDAPRIVNVTLFSPSGPGEFTEGDLLRFNVTYDATVAIVSGLDPTVDLGLEENYFYDPVPPTLPLGLNGSAGPLSAATYVAGSGTPHLVFEYVVRRTQDSGGLPLELYPPLTNETADLQPPRLLNLTANDFTIYRRAASPTQTASLVIPRAASKRVAAAEVVISSRAPRVNATFGVQVVGTPAALLYAGDTVGLVVGFDTAVEVSDRAPLLYLDTGLGIAVPAVYVSGSGSKFLEFEYEVLPFDATKAFEVASDAALVNIQGGWTRRFAATAAITADLSLATARERGALIRNSSTVALDGVPPVVTHYGISAVRNASSWQATTPEFPFGSGDGFGRNATLDDVVEITVAFDKPVVVLGAPRIRLDPGAIERAAIYASGNETRLLTFEYVVQLGDFTEALALKMDSLQAINLGQSTKVLAGGRVMLNSAKPLVDADLTLRLAAGATILAGAVLSRPPVPNVRKHASRNTTLVTARRPRPTYVTYIDFADPLEDYDATGPGTYGVGQLITLKVGFSDEVVLGAEPPLVQLNTGSQAVYLGGEGTKEMQFLYTVTAEDLNVEDLDVDVIADWVADVRPLVESPLADPRRTVLWCNATVGCGVFDRLGNSVNLTLTPNASAPIFRLEPGVAIDVTPPRILDVFCRTLPSTYDVGYGDYADDPPWFTVGERLDFAIEFDRTVVLASVAGPLLELGLGPAAVFPYATSLLEGGGGGAAGSTVLEFSYTVRAGDETKNLTLLGLRDNAGQARLLHASSLPTTAANYSLPANRRNRPISANSSQALFETIEVHTDRVPFVTTVSFAEDGLLVVADEARLAPGDTVGIEVFFSASVVVVGEPFIWVSAHAEAAALYAAGSGTAKLRFEYEVQPGDLALELDYKGPDALRTSLIDLAAAAAANLATRSSIFAAATVPTQRAILTLPESPTLASTLTVVVDGSTPRLVDVRLATETPSGLTWRASDRLYIELRFSAAVVVQGAPRLRLETGVIDRRATFVNGSNSTVLRFEYEVEPGDISSKLDYFSDLENFRTSVAALELLPTKAAEDTWIRRAAARPILDADSRLNPVRVEMGSASGLDATGDIYFERRGLPAPVVTGIAQYLDFTVFLAAHFVTIRFVAHVAGMGGIILSEVVTGDVEQSVDASIRVGDAVLFDAIDARTDAERDRYGGIPSALRFGHAEAAGDLFGWAVSAEQNAGDSGLILVGAPGKARPTAEVQLVHVDGDSLTNTREIQAFQVGVLYQPAVLTFTTDSDPGAIIGGTFRLQYQTPEGLLVGDEAVVASTAQPGELALLLQLAYPDFGTVTATREDYTFCACVHGYVWSVTFVGLHGQPEVGELILDGSGLSGAGARISDRVTRVEETSYVNGTWHVELPVHLRTATTVNESRAIQASADSQPLIVAMEDIGFDVINVDFEDTDNFGGRRWAVTFAEFVGGGGSSNEAQLDIPSIVAVPDASLLTSGPGANAFSFVVREGQSAVRGSFRLAFRSGDKTPPIQHNASAHEVQLALERLPSIKDVQVSYHRGLLAKTSWSYRVTFAAIQSRDRGGAWVPAPMGDLERLVVDASALRGSGATVQIYKHHELPSWTGTRRGSDGRQAGSAFVYERSTLSAEDPTIMWQPEFALTPGEDDQRGEAMMFGYSVGVGRARGNGVVYGVVGAPYAEEHGVSEIQNITCVANRGLFRLGIFDIFFSDWISANATTAEAIEAIEGSYGSLDPIHTLPKLKFTTLHPKICRPRDVLGGYAVENATLLIDFETPQSGPGSDTVVPATMDLLTVQTDALDGFVTVDRVRRGTRQPHGPGALGAACGAIFTFQRFPVDDYDYATGRFPSRASWRAVGRVRNTETCEPGDRLGWSLSIDRETGTVIGGAPGKGPEGAGRVLIFAPNPAYEELIFIRSLDSDTFGKALGDEFGFSCAVSTGSDGSILLVVGAPGTDGDTGAVFIFIARDALASIQGDYLLTQRLDASAGTELAGGVGQPGDRFGCSVAAQGDRILVGVCGAADVALGGDRPPPLGDDHRPLEPEVGAVLFYGRDGPDDPFELKQRLEPSNVKARDCFGTAVAIQNGTILATAVESLRNLGRREPADAPLTPRHLHVILETSSARGIYPAGATVGGTFRVGWRSTNVTRIQELCISANSPWSALDSRDSHCADLVLQAAVPSSLDAAAPEAKASGSTSRIIWTRELKHTATLLELKQAIEEDLQTGPTTVTRSARDAVTGSYAWNVTFRGLDEAESAEALRIDGGGLIGAAANATVTCITKLPTRVRGVSHVFVQKQSTGLWEEQALLRPFDAQRQSLFGYSAALDGDLVVVGAPNTDTQTSGTNAGAVRAYDFSFLSLEFREAKVNVTEGDAATCVLKRRDPQETTGIADGLAGRRLSAFVWTFARNSEAKVQSFLKDLYGLTRPRSTRAGETVAERVGAGTAHARASYYGGSSNSSAWVDGGRDDEGVSDFVPWGIERLLGSDVAAIDIVIETTDDDLYEAPDETVEVMVWLPGMFASQLGDMRCEVLIRDDGDGLDATAATAFETLGAAPLEEEDHGSEGPSFGGSSGFFLLDDDGGGAAQGRTTSMAAFVDASVAAQTPSDETAGIADEVVYSVVGVPAANASRGLVRVYRRQAGFWSLQQTLEQPEAAPNNASSSPSAITPEFGASVAASAIYGRDDAAILVGAPGVPAAYVFELQETVLRRNVTVVGLNGTLEVKEVNATLSNVWMVAAVFEERPTATRRQHEFGSSVALSGDVAVIGAAGLETVYVYRRAWDSKTSLWRWGTTATVVRSSDYDLDVQNDGFLTVVHEQGFGTAVALQANTLVVGAPYADYGNRGSPEDVETYATDGTDNRRLGKGKAYAFYSTPPQVVVTLRADAFLFNGSFTLALDDYRNESCLTDRFGFVADATTVRAGLEDACVVHGPLAGRIEVSRDAAYVDTEVPGGEKLAWTVTFLGEATAPPLEARWRHHGCPNCDAFNADWALNPQRQVLVEARRTNPPRGARSEGWDEVATLQAGDRVPNAAFGSAVAVDGDHVLVGAPQAPGAVAITWDFETGDLAGWTRTGDAFDAQPTYGDGPSYRPDRESGFAYDSRGDAEGGPDSRAARPRGRYWVGTAERRPGARGSLEPRPDNTETTGDYEAPAPGTHAGDSAGDAPMGTLTSRALVVPVKAAAVGDGHHLAVSFLVGGGCDPLREYVEILIDGAPVARETGRCDDRMRNATVNLDKYEGRALVIRVVDASQARWGHINVDHFTFSWPHRGSGAGRVAGAAAVDAFFDGDAAAASLEGAKALYASTGAPSSGGKAVARAGAAYAFRRRANATIAKCAGDKELCAFEFVARLAPSDGRAYDAFGSAVALQQQQEQQQGDDASTNHRVLALVGAPGATAKTHWKLRPPLRPAGGGPVRFSPATLPALYTDLRETVYLRRSLVGADLSNEFSNRATPVQLPMDAVRAPDFRQAAGSASDIRAGNAAPALWDQLARDVGLGYDAPIPRSPALDEAKEAGAVYVFQLKDAALDLFGTTLTPPRWAALELARLRPVSGFARDHLGAAVALAGRTILGAAPGSDVFGPNQGAAVAWDRDALRVRFLAQEYALVEGRRTIATIAVVRDALDADAAVTITYQTEDLTAKGVDAEKYAACYADEDPATRRGCGDYRQTRGSLHFAVGDTIHYFYVPVVDDDCHEPYAKYLQLTLAIPGAPALMGENYVAKLRIDDDDYDQANFCPDNFL